MEENPYAAAKRSIVSSKSETVAAPATVFDRVVALEERVASLRSVVNQIVLALSKKQESIEQIMRELGLS